MLICNHDFVISYLSTNLMIHRQTFLDTIYHPLTFVHDCMYLKLNDLFNRCVLNEL